MSCFPVNGLLPLSCCSNVSAAARAHHISPHGFHVPAPITPRRGFSLLWLLVLEKPRAPTLECWGRPTRETRAVTAPRRLQKARLPLAQLQLANHLKSLENHRRHLGSLPPTTPQSKQFKTAWSCQPSPPQALSHRSWSQWLDRPQILYRKLGT